MPIYKTGIRKDGQYQYRVIVNYTDAQGAYRQKSKCIYGAPEAKELEAVMRSSLAGDVPESRMTVQALFDEYVKNKSNDVRLTTLEKSKSILNREVLPTFGKTRLDSLSLKQLQEWRTKLGSRELSTTTKNNIYTEFSAMLNYAVKMDYLKRNLLNKLGRFKDVYFEKPEEKLHYYTAEQFKSYISEALKLSEKTSDYNYYVFFNIAFYTGMRKGEINALKWSDISGNIIKVRRSVAQKVKGSSIVETPTKNKSSMRDLQMPKKLIYILTAQKERQRKFSDYSEDFRVCGGSKCLSDTAIENFNKQCSTAAGLPHIKIHDFRHTHATLLVNNGINIQEVARRLGHSRIEMTWNTYAHLYPKEEERALKVLNEI